jgi:H(+)-transporting ATP synthase, vacuolar type, subunit D
VKTAQEEVEKRREKAYATLKRAVAVNGYNRMRDVASAIHYDHKITSSTRVAAGIRLPSLEFHQGEFKSQYSLAGTDSLIDQTMQDFLSLLESTAKLAELESSVWLLARELKKTQRHVNALEHIFIPDYKETLKYVEQALESKELESFFTMKRVKKNLGGEDGENPPDDSTEVH